MAAIEIKIACQACQGHGFIIRRVVAQNYGPYDTAKRCPRCNASGQIAMSKVVEAKLVATGGQL